VQMFLSRPLPMELGMLYNHLSKEKHKGAVRSALSPLIETGVIKVFEKKRNGSLEELAFDNQLRQDCIVVPDENQLNKFNIHIETRKRQDLFLIETATQFTQQCVENAIFIANTNRKSIADKKYSQKNKSAKQWRSGLEAQVEVEEAIKIQNLILKSILRADQQKGITIRNICELALEELEIKNVLKIKRQLAVFNIAEGISVFDWNGRLVTDCPLSSYEADWIVNPGPKFKLFTTQIEESIVQSPFPSSQCKQPHLSHPHSSSVTLLHEDNRLEIGMDPVMDPRALAPAALSTFPGSFPSMVQFAEFIPQGEGTLFSSGLPTLLNSQGQISRMSLFGARNFLNTHDSLLISAPGPDPTRTLIKDSLLVPAGAKI
jgi:hypothetical protein